MCGKYVEKCPFRQISKKFQKTWHIGNVKTWHTTWQLNGLKWAKLGAEDL